MPEQSMNEKLAAGELVLCMNLRLARSDDNTELQGELIRRGARFVIAGTDTSYVPAGARQDTAALRAIKLD
jgi:hypothetical protein